MCWSNAGSSGDMGSFEPAFADDAYPDVSSASFADPGPELPPLKGFGVKKPDKRRI